MRRFFLTVMTVAVAGLLWADAELRAQYVPPPQLVPGVDYNLPNYANSPILRKFKDKLPGLTAAGAAVPGFYSGANNLGQALPIALADTGTYPGDDYYEIAVVEYLERMHSNLPAPGTKLRGYVQIYPPGSTPPSGAYALTYTDGSPISFHGQQVYAYEKPHYLGPVIVATKGKATRVKFYNLLPTTAKGGDLFIPTDVTVMGAGMGPDGGSYSQNRATLHLHGGDNPWMSDGTAHQWITPEGETTNPIYIRGASQRDVPDMPIPQEGSATFYWPNGQSGRLMFYHDHAYGMTRLDVYAGEAAGYLLVDPDEQALTSGMTQIPLIIQDKTFVNDGSVPPAFKGGTATPATTAVDPLWASNPSWGKTKGSLWFPHVYMPNQNPNDMSGANPMGRWDYGAWFWPVFPSDPPPQTSIVPEAFMDTPLINGTAYPYLSVKPRAYRFRVLNASNDRYLNLQVYVASPVVSEIKLTRKGRGYAVPPVVTITPAPGDTTGQGATAEAIVDLTVGSPTFSRVTAIRMKTVGSGYTAPPTVTIAPPPSGGRQAAAVAILYSKPTEVGMFPASKSFGVRWPARWMANDTPGMTPNILDDRAGGVPDPRTMGPAIVQIGSEGGILPAPVVLRNTPIGYEQNKRSITVLNTMEHTLFLGPAERADIVIDFSRFAGKTLILYNDAPAPVPAGDPRNDYYTAGPDSSGMGGAPSTMAGFGPNTRTIMQIKVGGTARKPTFDPATLNAPMSAAFTKTQPAKLVPDGTYARISDTSMLINGVDTPLKPKTIQELFDPYGRMNSTLGVEVPFTSSVIQTTIPYGFIDPATEVITDGESQLWKITHNGVDTHAIHFHLFNVQVINRVGWDGAIKPPLPEELGWKETVKMNPLEDIVVALKAKTPTVPFAQPNNVRALDPTQPIDATTGFLGVDPSNNPVTVTNKLVNFGHEYTWHCHLLGHEENDMMRPIMVAAPPLPPSALSAALSGSDVLLTWTNTDPGTSGITVQRATDNGFTQNVESFSLGVVTSYTDTTTGGSTYFYRVNASGTVGSGVAGYPTVNTVSSWSDTVTP